MRHQQRTPVAKIRFAALLLMRDVEQRAINDILDDSRPTTCRSARATFGLASSCMMDCAARVTLRPSTRQQRTQSDEHAAPMRDQPSPATP
jgi:hypothetical protein